ncbi:MAG TPA: M20 family peptidase [Thermoanaerobaculia bacterium]|nr:M20 family peptidase [Thermoanaerobaculia bacterium]
MIRAAMKRALLVLGALLLILLAILIGRALVLPSMQIAAPAAPPLSIDRDAALARFTRAIRFPTVSGRSAEHDAFLAWLGEAYPRVHASLQRELVGGHSVLFTWRGSDPALAPVLLMGHYDVVPVEPGTESKWERPPFSGAVAGGFVWGRGTLDDKITVISLLEAIDSLLRDGFRPNRTILLAFGHDEEIGGTEGAAAVARLLISRGVRLHAVVDEGGIVTRDGIKGLDKPVALIGIAEKGSASVELLASGAGGHSSMPPPRTQVGEIASAIERVQTNPFPTGVRGATAEMLRWVAPEMPFVQRVLMSNVWLFEPILRIEAKSSPPLNAILRTTTAPTIISGGVKENVIPSHARAVINFRILPGDTVDEVVAHVRETAGSRVAARLLSGARDSSPVSDPRTPQFRTLQRTIEQVFPDAVVAPYLVVGGTDARHFESLTPNVYRFIPLVIEQSDLSRVHGTNERVAVESYFEAIRFYRMLAMNFAR